MCTRWIQVPLLLGQNCSLLAHLARHISIIQSLGRIRADLLLVLSNTNARNPRGFFKPIGFQLTPRFGNTQQKITLVVRADSDACLILDNSQGLATLFHLKVMVLGLASSVNRDMVIHKSI
jgi:hypothetical protein